MEIRMNRKDVFCDITTEEISLRFKDEEMVGTHKFRHIDKGIYVAEPSFVLTENERKKLDRTYGQIEFCGYYADEADRKSDFTVVFAYAEEQFMINWINHEGPKDENFLPFFREDRDFMHSIEVGQDFNIFGEVTKKKKVMKHVYKPLTDGKGYEPWIELEGSLGVMVEEGIYYFPGYEVSEPRLRRSLPEIDINNYVHQKMAGICHVRDIHPTSLAEVEYLAVGEEHFDRLEELCSELKDGFVHEFKYLPEGEEPPEDHVLSLDEIMEEISKEKSGAGEQEEPQIPEGAKELVEGLGISDITLRYSMPLICDTNFRSFDCAYRLGDELVLLSHCHDGHYEEDRHDLRLMDKLYVKDIKKLNCGVDYPYIYRVIDDEENKLREMLRDDYYEAFIRERDGKKEVEKRQD